MLDYSQIKEMAQDAAERAEEEGLKPFSIHDLNLQDVPPFPFPFLGEYVPEGWEILPDENGQQQTFLCDSSGFGDDDEPALSVGQLLRKLEQWKQSGEDVGFGIVESGEFQIVLGLYRPDSRDFTHTGNLTNDELNRLRRK
jgi:hypothetical protein